MLDLNGQFFYLLLQERIETIKRNSEVFMIFALGFMLDF